MRKEAIRRLENNIIVMTEIDPDDFKDQKGPAVSIYLPLHHDSREGRRDDKDRIEFKNLAKKAKAQLEDIWGKDETKSISDKLDFILERNDLDFWLDEKAEGLAFLINTEECYVYEMDGSPAPIVVVDEKFDMAPIFGEAVHDQQMLYKLLLISSDHFAILDGTATSLHYEKLPDDVKEYFAETYPEFDGETTALDYYSLEDHMSPFHDHKSRNDVTQEETTKFFRYVNKVLSEKLLKDNTVPVILVTAPEHVNEFEKICSVELYPKVIKKDPNGVTGKQLREMAESLLSEQ